MFAYRQSTLKPPQQLPTVDVESYKPKASAKKANKCWIKNDLYSLDKRDKEIMYSNTSWLVDNIVNAAQKLMKEMFPTNNGFQDVCLGRIYIFDVETSEFIQILHNGHDHWLTISTIGAKEGEVFIYDSLYCSVSPSVKAQIACLLATRKELIELKFMDVQMQSGKYDCGLFAVAFACALVCGEHPGKFLFEQQEMRKHLRMCLQQRSISMFPVKKTRRVLDRVKSKDLIEIFCICRMPQIPGIEMIECSKCKSWYHVPMCVQVLQEAKKRGACWFCDNCATQNNPSYITVPWHSENSKLTWILCIMLLYNLLCYVYVILLTLDPYLCFLPSIYPSAISSVQSSKLSQKQLWWGTIHTKWDTLH